MSDYSLFYKTMAEGMDDMMISINNNLDPIDKNVELLNYLLDLTTALDFNVNRALRDIRPVMRGTVYRGLIIDSRSRYKVTLGVQALNEHTKRYENSDLTDFVNNEVWAGECVPYEWAIASEETGEDISGWNICNPS